MTLTLNIELRIIKLFAHCVVDYRLNSLTNDFGHVFALVIVAGHFLLSFF